MGEWKRTVIRLGLEMNDYGIPEIVLLAQQYGQPFVNKSVKIAVEE